MPEQLPPFVGLERVGTTKDSAIFAPRRSYKSDDAGPPQKPIYRYIGIQSPQTGWDGSLLWKRSEFAWVDWPLGANPEADAVLTYWRAHKGDPRLKNPAWDVERCCVNELPKDAAQDLPPTDPELEPSHLTRIQPTR